MGICTSHDVHDALEVTRVAATSPPKLKKRVSDMNLVPNDFLHHQWYKIDESNFEPERRLLVFASPTSSHLPAKILLFDVDSQSALYGQKISELVLPNTGDELLYGCWACSASTSTKINSTLRVFLIAPCFNTSRVYIFNVDDESQFRVFKCVESKNLFQKDILFPLDCFSCPGKDTPLFLSVMGQKKDDSGGALLKMDRTQFTITQGNEKERHESMYGGTFAIHPRQNVLIATEWGHPEILRTGLQLGDEANKEFYGTSLNVWEIKPRSLKQTIYLNDFDGKMPICIRFVHNPELVHAFVCTLGGAIYHLHKDSRTESFVARKAFQFANAHVTGWIQEEVPAVPVDMVISIDDQFLYISCWLQGCVQQFNIVDPFNITPAHKVFLGGVIHKEFGVTLQRISTINFMPTRQCFREATFEGGPSRLQLSLDGRRLFVGNSWITSCDNKYYPKLQHQGSIIALIRVNVNSAGSMTLDKNFRIQLMDDKLDKAPYFAREMKFMNGDCTSDAFV